MDENQRFSGLEGSANLLQPRNLKGFGLAEITR